MSAFSGKVVLITGGTSGIGRATAVAFGEQGADVVVAGRRETEGAETVALVEKAGGRGWFVRADVSSEEDIAALVAKTAAHFGGLHFAFNNAGISLEQGAVTNTTGEVFDRIMNVNVRGVFLSMKHEIPAILASGGGAVVNNASVLGLRPLSRNPIYNASKAAVISLTQTMALEYSAKGVRVNAVCPGIIETDLTEGLRGNEQMRSFCFRNTR